VYRAPDTAERFEASFVDDTAGWRQVSIPMTDFVRSADQPAGAPDDGLGLDEVWGYGFAFPNGTASGEARIDLVRRSPFPPPTELVVTNLDDGGPGSLREALALIADGGTITFDPALTGGTITLTSGQLVDRPIGHDRRLGGGPADDQRRERAPRPRGRGRRDHRSTTSSSVTAPAPHEAAASSTAACCDSTAWS
jgi:hypothetical protein